jgi:hypothetical protein
MSDEDARRLHSSFVTQDDTEAFANDEPRTTNDNRPTTLAPLRLLK